MNIEQNVRIQNDFRICVDNTKKVVYSFMYCQFFLNTIIMCKPTKLIIWQAFGPLSHFIQTIITTKREHYDELSLHKSKINLSITIYT